MCYKYVFMYRQHICMDTYTDTYVYENKFYRKENKKQGFLQLSYKSFFSPHDMLSVGKLYSVAVGSPTVVLSSVSPPLTEKICTRLASVFTCTNSICIHPSVSPSYKKQNLKEIP